MARILVIDDEHNIRTMVRLALQHEGYEVETAADGQEGLDRFADGRDWDLVLVDQRMPGIEGLTVLKQLLYHNSEARVIMITAFGTVDLAVDAMKAGARDFLRKPFTTETLRGAVRVALGDGRSQAPMQSSAANLVGSQSGLVTFGMTTINGFRIEFKPDSGIKLEGELGFSFMVRSPEGESRHCTVTLAPYVAEQVRAHADREVFPGGNRFWQALCEEALANYLYQNAAAPSDGLLKVEEYSTGLRRFVDSVLTGVN